MSSRNVRLTAEGRAAAPIIFRALSTAKCEAELQQILSTEKLLEVDYATFIDEETFLPADERSKSVRAIFAGWINGVRLLDNMQMEISA
jgi:pantoate--beta-alanine ligase